MTFADFKSSSRRWILLMTAALPVAALIAWWMLGASNGSELRARLSTTPHEAVAAHALAPVRPPRRLAASLASGLRNEQGKPPAHVAPEVLPKLKAQDRAATFDQEEHMSPAARLNRWNGEIARASLRFGVPQSWLRAVMEAESGGRTMSSETEPITSTMGAMGLMQLMPDTYAEMRAAYRLGPDPYDPHDNITAAAAYLRWLYKRYGYPTMFAAYNDGPGNLEQRLVEGRMLPLETQLYVGEITGTRLVRANGPKSLAKLTRPNGAPVWINGFAVGSVRPPLPGEYAAEVRSVIQVGKMHQGVKETVAQATALLRAHGGRV